MGNKIAKVKTKAAKTETATRITGAPFPDYWVFAGIALAVLLVYARTIQFGFSPMDDQWLIVSKTGVLENVQNLPGFFTENIYDLFYRPLLNVSFMIDQLISGSPSAFHFTNICSTDFAAACFTVF